MPNTSYDKRNSSRKYIISWIIVVICLLLMGGCANKKLIDNKSIHIALSIPNRDSELCVNLINDIDDKLSKEDFIFNYEASDDSVTIQLSKIEKMLEKEPDYIIIYPVSIYGFETIIEKANNLGTKIIIIGGDVNIESVGSVLAKVMPDYELEGRLSAEELYSFFESNTNEINILEIQGKLGTTQTRDIAKGFRNQLLNYANVELIDVSQNNINRNDAYSRTKEMIDKHGGMINAVFAHNDESGLGVVDAFLEVEYDLHLIPIVSIGGDDDIKAAIIAKQYFSGVQSNLNYGESIVNIILNDLEGKEVKDVVLPTQKIIMDQKD